MKLRITKGGPAPAPRVETPGRKRMLFSAVMPLGLPGMKTFTEIKGADGRPSNYLDVTIKGYLSTFEQFTKSDRMGDYVIPGAFTQTIPRFLANPVLLVDHRNACDYLAGSFTKLVEDSKGLYVEALLSNSPCDDMVDLRYKLVEGHLRSLSMGGIFHYQEDGRGIFKVDLFEGSLTPVPMNPDALISTRAMTPEEEVVIDRGGWIHETARSIGLPTAQN